MIVCKCNFSSSNYTSNATNCPPADFPTSYHRTDPRCRERSFHWDEPRLGSLCETDGLHSGPGRNRASGPLGPATLALLSNNYPSGPPAQRLRRRHRLLPTRACLFRGVSRNSANKYPAVYRAQNVLHDNHGLRM